MIRKRTKAVVSLVKLSQCSADRNSVQGQQRRRCRPPFFYTILFKVKGHQKFVSKVSLFYVTFLTVDVVVKKWFMNNKARHIFMAAFASQVRDTVVWGEEKDKRESNLYVMSCNSSSILLFGEGIKRGVTERKREERSESR